MDDETRAFAADCVIRMREAECESERLRAALKIAREALLAIAPCRSCMYGDIARRALSEIEIG